MAAKKMTKARRQALLEKFYQQFKEGMVKLEGKSFGAIIQAEYTKKSTTTDPLAKEILATIAEIEGIAL